MALSVNVDLIAAPEPGYLDPGRQWLTGNPIPLGWWREWELQQALTREVYANGGGAPYPAPRPTAPDYSGVWWAYDEYSSGDGLFLPSWGQPSAPSSALLGIPLIAVILVVGAVILAER